jgi:DNA-directed RNA polymerase II subunit RPB2
LNRSSVERGLFSSVKFVTHRDEERANGGDNERFENPNELSDVVGLRVGNYSLLEESGVLPVGSVVHSGDAIIGKTVATSCAEGIVKGRRQTTKNDRSIISKNETSVVDSVMRSTKPDGSRTVKVKTRVTRSPIVGDKVSSRMGQKGVVGAMLAQEDMPFTSEGIVPDIIMNPHAIPSRMTCGQLLECLLGKLSAQLGEFGDSTPFSNVQTEDIAAALEREGFDAHGNEVMYDG